MRILFIDDDAGFSNAFSEILADQDIQIDEAECGEMGIELADVYDYQAIGLDLGLPEMKIIDVFICKLRRKIGRETHDAALIETVWGRGYRVNAEAGA